MDGFDLFIEKFEGLSFKKRKELIKKIFGLKRVVLYTVDDEERVKVFRIYDGDRYYKFMLYFDYVLDNYMYNIIVREIYVNCKIYVLDYNIKNDFGRNIYFTNFMKILKEKDVSYFDLLL